MIGVATQRRPRGRPGGRRPGHLATALYVRGVVLGPCADVRAAL